jgi:hypothetical protein
VSARIGGEVKADGRAPEDDSWAGCGEMGLDTEAALVKGIFADSVLMKVLRPRDCNGRFCTHCGHAWGEAESL